MSLSYDKVYHLHCMLTLNGGRKINLRRLDQRQTYWGHMVGTPNAESNECNLQYVMKLAKDFALNGSEPMLIPPKRRDYHDVPGDRDQVRQRGRVPEFLDEVVCIADFESYPPVRDDKKHGSCLTVVWFQSEFSPPIDPEIVNAIQALDWDALAFDFDW